jgi:hypothetical protein
LSHDGKGLKVELILAEERVFGAAAAKIPVDSHFIAHEIGFTEFSAAF